MTSRPNYIDYSKFIGIYLVVVGHYTYALGIPFVNNSVWNLMHIITLFHMPLFFFISGYLYKDLDIKTTINKGTIQLVKPYIYISFLCLALMTVYNLCIGNFSLRIIASVIIGIISGSDLKWCRDIYAGALWFCYSLFFIKLLKSITNSFSKNYNHYICLAISLLGGGYILYSGNILPFRIDSTLVGFIFFYIGYLAKDKLNILFNNKMILLITLLLSAIVLYISSFMNLNLSIRQGLSINACYFGPYPYLFILSGLSGTLLILGFSHIFSKIKSKFVLELSNGTIIVLGFHWIIYLILFKWWIQSSNIYVALLIAFVDLLLCYGLIKIVERYCPVLLGNRKLR